MRDRSRNRRQRASSVRETPTAETATLNMETTVQTPIAERKYPMGQSIGSAEGTPSSALSELEAITQFLALVHAEDALSERDLAALVSSFYVYYG